MPFVLLTGSTSGEVGVAAFARYFCLPIIVVYAVALAAVLLSRTSPSETSNPPASHLHYPRPWQRVRFGIVALCALISGAGGVLSLVNALDSRRGIVTMLGRIFVASPDEGYIPLGGVVWALIGLGALRLDRRAAKSPTPRNIEQAARIYAVFWIHLCVMLLMAGYTVIWSLGHVY